MQQYLAVFFFIACISLSAGLNMSPIQSVSAQTTSSQSEKPDYHLMGLAELVKLAETGDAAALRQLEKRYAPPSDQPPANKNQKNDNSEATVLGTSKGLGILVTTPKTANSQSTRSYKDMQKELDELEAKIKASLEEIKAGTYDDADKKETATIIKRVKEVQAEIIIEQVAERVEILQKSTKIVGETIEIMTQGLNFVWTMNPDELKALAEKGDSKAQVELASRYEEGERGFKKNATAGFQWMLKASRGGSAHAQHFTSGHYHNGKGVAVDQEKATFWLRKSAENGNKFAQFDLHQELADERYLSKWQVGKKFPEEAEFWLNKAVEQGLEIAILHKKERHSGE